MATRPLTLHASALTNEEYTLYTTSLCDLAGEDDDARTHVHDDSYYASLTISAREARAWIRGRYTDLAPANVDAVLRLFCPSLGPADVLSGGQFFAALRLVTHLRHGKPLDGNLVFVQAHPDDSISGPTPHGRPSTDSTRTSKELDTRPSDLQPTRSRSPPLVPPRLPPPPPPPKPSSAQLTPPSTSTNPFINRSKSQPPHTASASSFPFHSQAQPSSATPPLPPRKPVVPPPPPPRHASLPQGPAITQTPTTPSAFAFWHNHSQPGSTPTHPNVLIQQSLQAGRIAQSLKKAEQKLEKERVLEVLKSSSKAGSSSSSIRTRSASPTKESNAVFSPSSSKTVLINSKTNSASSKSTSESNSTSSEELRPSTRASSATVTTHNRVPALPPRRSSRRFSPPLSSAGSTRSFEQVATATVPHRPTPSRAQSTFVREPSPLRANSPPLHPDLVAQPPPTHPDRKLREYPDSNPGSDIDTQPSPTSRAFRSKSMHYTSPPVPPPRRRPESVQYGGLSRHASSRDRTPSPSRTERSSKSLSTVLSSPASIPPRGAPPGGGGNISRHMSLSMHNRRRDSLPKEGATRDDSTIDSTISNIKNTLLGLQPKIEAARYKAEAGLSKRGYVPHSNASLFHEDVEERLVSSRASSVTDVTSGVSVDSDDGGLGQDVSILDIDDRNDSSVRTTAQRWDGRKWDDTGRLRSSSGGALPSEERKPRRAWDVERDEMKWPTGEGWRPL
ncbi:hypothetical protein BDW22DRAFT_1358787 [Trametopsis cervina]|nr:hypothetical protein BDW22DRAFT_1358787 [Trametopsis cervina]